mgnify:CR=1 FL=1
MRNTHIAGVSLLELSQKKSGVTRTERVDEEGLNGAQRARRSEGIGVRSIYYKGVEYKSYHELARFLDNTISANTLSVLGRKNFNSIITITSWHKCKFIQLSGTKEEMIGQNWKDLGFTIVEW